MTIDDRRLLKSMFHAAIKAADPRDCLRGHLPERPRGKTVVIGAGKGAAHMAAALEELWDGPLSGAIVTRYGYGCPTTRIRVLEAAHPVPDEAGLRASRCLMGLVSELGPDDLVIALMCGGGSSLLPMPLPGISLSDEIQTNQALLKSGLSIAEMNVIRKHTSGIKGGRLAAATSARVSTLVVSDIPGDDPALVASGPTIPDPATRQAALSIVQRSGIRLPVSVVALLQSSAADAPNPNSVHFARNTVDVIASASLSLEAAGKCAIDHGVGAAILSDSFEGEARIVAGVHASIAREVLTKNRPFRRPVVLLSGGETTVSSSGAWGRGGRNTEFALAFALAQPGLQVAALAADTDGIDGSEDNSGAFVDSATLSRLRGMGLDAQKLLANHDSYSAFEALNDLFVTGATGTNVNDFRAILVK
ncbi:glycerate kinase [Agrobacterium larrymoorei]|uniref:Glycerate kinase n=1 Tax=Agrobacterium larrymoorei TaxID=160699 RepID=A0A4D7DXW5_9HYPH|nr:glycerate kinase [Agrobacterium larrymoorei]QCJ01109.1 glycerate kinase [Agrobacterium larrymoorei]QYA10121.1 glycerate kinase [Agrobacterium larrymoorei]